MFCTFGHTQIVFFAHTVVEERFLPLVESCRIGIFDRSCRVEFAVRKHHLVIGYIIDVVTTTHIANERLTSIAARQSISLILSVQILIVKRRPKSFVVFGWAADDIVLRNTAIVEAQLTV